MKTIFERRTLCVLSKLEINCPWRPADLNPRMACDCCTERREVRIYK